MSDMIYRQDAIDAMCDACSDWCDEGVCKKASAIQRLPSAQSQPEEDCDTCKHGYFGDRQCDNCRMRYPSHYEREEEQHA